MRYPNRQRDRTCKQADDDPRPHVVGVGRVVVSRLARRSPNAMRAHVTPRSREAAAVECARLLLRRGGQTRGQDRGFPAGSDGVGLTHRQEKHKTLRILNKGAQHLSYSINVGSSGTPSAARAFTTNHAPNARTCTHARKRRYSSVQAPAWPMDARASPSLHHCSKAAQRGGRGTALCAAGGDQGAAREARRAGNALHDPRRGCQRKPASARARRPNNSVVSRRRLSPVCPGYFAQ